ncbi:MAG: ABC transporter substrate-binding protein [Rhodospirillales bacterium]|nr:ABC transporter substrate-binding protein [Rhodospirillales bacterium]
MVSTPKLRRRHLAAAAASFAITRGAQAQPPDVIIGAPNCLTGGLGEAGQQVVKGLELLAEQVNAAGGIKSLGGARLKIIPADTSTDNPAQAASVTRRLIAENHCSALVGSHASTMTLSSQIEAERGRVPILTTSYADQIVERGFKYTFKIPPQSASFGLANIDYTRKIFADAGRKLQRVAVFYGSDAGNGANGRAEVAQVKKAGLDLVASGSVPTGMSDPTPVVGPVLATKPDLLMANLVTPDMVMVIHALRAVGARLPIMTSGSGISVKSIPQNLGDQADGFMGTVVWNDDLKVPGAAAFLKAFLKANPKQTFAPQEAGEGYATGQIIAAALEKAATTDPRKLRDAIAAIRVQTILPGGPVEFAPNGLSRHGIPLMVQWQKGELHTIWPKAYQTARPIVG